MHILLGISGSPYNSIYFILFYFSIKRPSSVSARPEFIDVLSGGRMLFCGTES